MPICYRSIDELKKILAETPPAARYLDASWKIATTAADWMCIKYRMIGAWHAAEPKTEAAEIYHLLSKIADDRMHDALRHAEVLAA